VVQIRRLRVAGSGAAQPLRFRAVTGGGDFLGAAAERTETSPDRSNRIEPDALFPADQFIVVIFVVAKRDQVSLNLHHQRRFDPALLVAEKHPDRALFDTELG